MMRITIVCLLLIVVVVNCTDPPTQVHLSFSGKSGEMVINWITRSETSASICKYGYVAGTNNLQKVGTAKRYNAGLYSAVVHEAVLTGLPADKEVFYRCGDGTLFSAETSFKTASANPRPFRFISFGDFDLTSASYKTAQRLTEQTGFDFIIHQGDIPYAWTEDRWDTWGSLVEPISSKYAYMVAPGNHEDGNNFASYMNRFSTVAGKNSGSNSNLYYSFTYSWVHFIGFSTEHNYKEGSEQYRWAENDLKNVDRTTTPFIIAFAHRPMYSSNINHGSDENFRAAIEPLLRKYKVDMILFGHVHAYERTCPVYKGICIIGRQSDSAHYVNPKATIHVVAGTAGYELNPHWVKPKPVWSDYRETNHGFLIVDVVDRFTMSIEFRRNDKTTGDHFIIQRTQPAIIPTPAPAPPPSAPSVAD